MNKRYFLAFLGSCLAAIILAVGSKAIDLAPAAAQSPPLLVAAAASLQDALEEIAPLFEAANGISVNHTFAASGPLQRQIEQGAPVDVFISAASRQMDALQQQGLILPETRRNLLTNSLVLVVPANSGLGLSGFRQLTDAAVRKISIGEPRSVPAGQYAEEVFKNLGILDQLRPKLVYGNSVRNVLSTVESGNADAGIVYRTDARISNRVNQVATAPATLHSPIIYPIAAIRSRRNLDAARAYEQFLMSDRAAQIFRRYGFGIAR